MSEELKTIQYNITLQQQPTLTSVSVNPSQEWLTDNKYSVKGSEYEEWSYTGSEKEIKEQQEAELAEGNNQAQITTTITRLNGNLWQLQVRKAPLIKSEAEATPEEQEHGSKDNPKQLSVSITAIQESVLNHPKYANLTPEQRGAIKAYMNGASAGQKVADKNGNPIRLHQIMPINDSLV